jgi:hypothetical protein
VRRQRPEQVRRAVIELYRQVGLTWAEHEGRRYELDGRSRNSATSHVTSDAIVGAPTTGPQTHDDDPLGSVRPASTADRIRARARASPRDSASRSSPRRGVAAADEPVDAGLAAAQG